MERWAPATQGTAQDRTWQVEPAVRDVVLTGSCCPTVSAPSRKGVKRPGFQGCAQQIVGSGLGWIESRGVEDCGATAVCEMGED